MLSALYRLKRDQSRQMHLLKMHVALPMTELKNISYLLQ